MSSASNCCTSVCQDTEVVNVPGVQGEAGADGADGTDGVNAFTVTTADFNVPAVGANVSVSVADSSWMTVDQTVVSEGPAHFQVVSKSSSTQVTLEFLGYSPDVSPGAVVSSGAQISPSGPQPVVTGITALTDNSTGTASNTIAAGVGIFTLSIPIQLAAMTNAAADLVTEYTPGFKFKLLSISFATTTIGAGAGASQVLNLEIGTTNVTGGLLTLTEAGTSQLGERTDATAITAANTGSASDFISLEVAAGGTVFTAGAGVVLIRVQNMDTADAVASLADHVNDLLAELV